MICADPDLAQWDGRMGQVYKQKYALLVGNDRRALLEEQRRWLASRDAQCDQTELAAAKPCILQFTKARLATLQQLDREPLQLARPSAAASGTTRFFLGCSKVDGVRRSQCELSEALLNRNCESIQDHDQKGACGVMNAGESEYSQYYRLKHICDADWIPTVAKECAARAVLLEPELRKKLADYVKPTIGTRRAQAEVDSNAAFATAASALLDCVDNQAATMMVTNENADAIANAAIALCRPELRNAARASDYKSEVSGWSEGPQPKGCADGSLRCVEAEKAITDPLLPALAARVMRDRAEAARTTRQPDNAPARPRDGSASEDTSGTAFLVSKDGTALTNAHVVERCRHIRVGMGGQEGTARIVAQDEMNDLALLATDLHPVQVPNWRLSVRQGEDIVVYGFPLTGVLASGGNVATGNVTALAGLSNDSRFLQISAPIQPGNSGGPLLDRAGNVVGIVVAKLNTIGIASVTGDIPQNVNFAIKASVAAAFLDAQHVAHAEGLTAGALSTPDISEQAKALAAQVVCVR
jgi:S1-C subfamily serine protease